jgi:Asp-tRNA(Asn)/Glu-tRNA(Gln) amidotransferase A subunit family amidase
MMSNIPSIAKAAVDLRSGELTVVELVDRCLERIELLEGRVRAWVMVDAAGARLEARRLDALLDDGEDLGPLHGIPVGIKDLFDVAGWPTKAGSPLREDHRATRDAPVVARLREAGAIFLGKTVTTQFASFDPSPTRNPWNLDRTPGGSSSGSAAAVATGMCLAALGTQTGGSIIRPASYCGVAGYKPAYGALDMRGVVPLAHHLDHVGPIGQTVEDLYLLWQTLARRAPEQAIELLQVKHLDRSFDSWLDSHSQTMIIHPAEHPLLERADADVREVTAAALSKLKSSFRSEPIHLPASLAEVPMLHRRIMAVEAAAYHRETFGKVRDQYGPNISKLLDEGLATTAVDYADALAHQRRFRQEMLELLTASRREPLACIVMPSTSTAAPDKATTGDPLFVSPWSYAGLPAVTIPCGLTADGLPCGLQFVGAVAVQTLAMAGLVERVLQFNEVPPIVKELM